MDESTRSPNRRTDRIPCECGCGELILKYGTDRRLRRFVRGHQFKGNKFGAKPYDLARILAQAEPLRPHCRCGCGEKLAVPPNKQRKGVGLVGIQSHWERHPYLRYHGTWGTRTQNLIQKLGSIPDTEYGLLYGTLLGDAAIIYPNKRSRFPRIAWTHGQIQQSWSEYKAQRLASLRIKCRITENRGYGTMSAVGRSVCHPDLVAVYDVVRPDRQAKCVTAAWLERITPEGLAWWYMDDGSLSHTPAGTPQIQLHTEGFSQLENQFLADWLTGLGYPTKARRFHRASHNKDFDYLSMGADTSRKWLADLRQYAIPSMDYKFRDRPIDRTRNRGSSL